MKNERNEKKNRLNISRLETHTYLWSQNWTEKQKLYQEWKRLKFINHNILNVMCNCKMKLFGTIDENDTK